MKPSELCVARSLKGNISCGSVLEGEATHRPCFGGQAAVPCRSFLQGFKSAFLSMETSDRQGPRLHLPRICKCGSGRVVAR